MPKVKNTLIKVKNHVTNHKFAYTMTVVAIATTYGNLRMQKQIASFLTEKGIDPLEFQFPEYYEELNGGAY